MSNSFTSPPVLVDPARVITGLTVRAEEAKRLADMQNHSFADGGCGDVVNQAWDSECFEFTDTSLTDVCEWYIPHPSEEHIEFKFRISAYSSLSGGVAKVTVNFPLGGSYSAQTTITDSSRYNSVFNVITVAISAVENDEIAQLTLSLQAPSGGTIEVANIQGNWSSLSSPLATRTLDQFTEDFIPQGQSRVGADQALPSRFGVDTLNNIGMLRKRGRTVFNWSGVSGASSAAPQGLGTLDPLLKNSVMFLAGGADNLSLKNKIFVKAANISTTLDVDIFGYRLTLNSNGWSSFYVDQRPGYAHHVDFSPIFKRDVYKLGLGLSPNNDEVLLGPNNLITSSPPYILGLSILAV
jgi:hypothetical protein